MSDEIKLLLNAVIKNQELAHADQEAFKSEMLNFRKEMNSFRNETNDRLDNIDSQLIGIKRDIRSMGTDLDKTINRVNKIEQQTSH
jgi:hypothetical protein